MWNVEVDNRHWEDASLKERKAVVDFYNKYYNKEPQPISFEECEFAWVGRRFITIKYTFGVKPI